MWGSKVHLRWKLPHPAQRDTAGNVVIIIYIAMPMICRWISYLWLNWCIMVLDSCSLPFVDLPSPRTIPTCRHFSDSRPWWGAFRSLRHATLQALFFKWFCFISFIYNFIYNCISPLIYKSLYAPLTFIYNCISPLQALNCLLGAEMERWVPWMLYGTSAAAASPRPLPDSAFGSASGCG